MIKLLREMALELLGRRCCSQLAQRFTSEKWLSSCSAEGAAPCEKGQLTTIITQSSRALLPKLALNSAFMSERRLPSCSDIRVLDVEIQTARRSRVFSRSTALLPKMVLNSAFTSEKWLSSCSAEGEGRLDQSTARKLRRSLAQQPARRDDRL